MANSSSKSQQPEAEPEMPEEGRPDEDEEEFKITVKKLDRVVRPRGVLADG